MTKISEIFGSMVFSDSMMENRLPKESYRALKGCIARGEPLTREIANVAASAMKEWAIEKGATHFTHWFQPLNGITAEKHDSFISSDGRDGIIMEFSGKDLICGEPDASSFPSGGIRATFEARGYTAWDPTSYAFVKDNTLCIPTVFCSWSGEALDKKTPLLRSMEAFNLSALRILRLFGDTKTKRIDTTLGAEQEYFLVDKSLYLARRDLRFAGRTLLGAMAPKGQEMDDHYFGIIAPRVKSFMSDLNEELWKLGILAKTEHNEVAPSQHELAPVFTTSNIAVDQNQLTMETMKKVADRHGMVCLLHEKPFDGVNGSGKHNNWSVTTDLGSNLLDPGNSPYENSQFLLFLCAVIAAVDEHADLMRISVASAGNDHRLGASEAPPAIVSMFLGDELTQVLESFEKDEDYLAKDKKALDMGISVLPKIPKDSTDRNRTSPFAFTGNKFEFRMPGSALSCAGPITVLNSIVADTLDTFAMRLEGASDFDTELHDIIKDTVHDHKRIIFNGDGYNEDWVKEAQNRGLHNYPTTVDCLPFFMKAENVALFERHKVYTRTEMQAHQDIKYEIYSKTVIIEAKTMLDMIKKEYLPSVLAYETKLSKAIINKKEIGMEASAEEKQLKIVSDGYRMVYEAQENLNTQMEDLHRTDRPYEIARICHDGILDAMGELRRCADALEPLIPDTLLPYPTYSKLLFSVN